MEWASGFQTCSYWRSGVRSRVALLDYPSGFRAHCVAFKLAGFGFPVSAEKIPRETRKLRARPPG